MPRGKSTSGLTQSVDNSGITPRKALKGDEWGGFVQVSIDDAHRDEFDLWLSEIGDGVTRELDDAVGSGLKFSLAFDGQNQCYIATFTGRPDIIGQRAFTCALSARGGTLSEAIAVLIYKHVPLLHYDWWDAVNEPKKSRYTFG